MGGAHISRGYVTYFMYEKRVCILCVLGRRQENNVLFDV